MEEDTTLGFSEYFAKIEEASLLQKTSNNSDTAHYEKDQRLHKDDKMTIKSLTKKRSSFSLNKESISIPVRKTKSLSSHFLVDVDKLMNCVSESFDETGQTLNGSCEKDDMAFLSICASPLSSESSPDDIILKNPKSDISASIEEDNTDSYSWRKMQIEPGIGIYLKFEDVNYSVRCKGKNSNMEKCILQGVSGSVSPGEILALMGPSGGGKTTLLNLLSGRMKHNGGVISYNDKLYTKSLKRRIGFVLQDDVVFPHLTVKETLTYSALLRLPNTLSRDEKKERAMNVVSELGLEGCQDTMIGGKFVRGVSGGERKRVCIGNEILLNPSLLFLDEPTSSLDSTTALRIVQMLRNIAKDGKTVVTTIHQPSSRLFSKFDKLILLSKGCSLYSGKASEAMMYFSSIGCSPLIAMNPAEFLIDLANGNIKDKSVPSKLEDKFLPCDVHEYLLGVYESRTSNAERIQIKRRNTTKRESERQYIYNAHEYGASWSEQFSILFTRGLKERRHEYLSSLRVIQVLSTAFIMGLLWWRSDASSNEKIQDQAGLLFFISIFWTFFPLFTAIFTFPQEREMLAKERSVDMYKLSAYLTARNTSDLPLDLLLPVIFLAIVYSMTGLKPNFSAFWLTLCTIFLSIIASQGLGLTIGAALMDVKKATTLASITVMTFMLCGGFFIEKVPTFMSWIRYVSLNYHTYRLLLKIQYSCAGDPYGSGSVNCELHSNFLKSQRLNYGGIVEIGALLVMIIGYRLVTYILLRRMKLINVT